MQMASNGAASGLGTRNSGPFTPIARQTSIYSLTLDELQNNYEGKNFGSMNMDEFLKNIWTAEESQAIASALASTNETNNPKPSASGAASGGLARQGSLSRQVSLPGVLSRKTVDEVWKDIQRGSQVKPKELQQQVSYGEMTLEDFLVKAGVVREESEETEAATSATPAADAPSRASGSFPFGPGSVTGGAFQEAGPLARATHQATMDAIAAHNHQQSWLNYQLKATQMQQHHFLQQQQHQAAAEAAAAAYENAKRGGLPLVAIPGTSSGSGMDGSSDGGLGHGNGLALSPTTNTQDSPLRGKKRNHDNVVEKTVERRQRRMIKNRESAARSRARKQAYTVELEAEVTQLKEENTRLKTQQMLEKLIPITESSPPKKVLRRTKTNPW